MRVRIGAGRARGRVTRVARDAALAAARRRAVAAGSADAGDERARRRMHQRRVPFGQHRRVKARRAFEVVREHQRRRGRVDRRARAFDRRRIGARAIRRHEQRALVRARNTVLRIAERLGLGRHRPVDDARTTAHHQGQPQPPRTLHARVALRIARHFGARAARGFVVADCGEWWRRRHTCGAPLSLVRAQADVSSASPPTRSR